MNQILQLLILSLTILTLLSCSQEKKSKILMRSAKMLEADFQNKDIAEEKINKVLTDYLASFENDSIGFDIRFNLLSQNYLNKKKQLIHHSKYSKKKTVENLMLYEQVEIFNFRKSFTYGQLDTLTVKEVLTIQNEGNISLELAGAEMKSLVFYNSNQASGLVKTVFQLSSVLFDRESEQWKIDLFGDPLHKKMKDQKLASLQNKNLSEYKETMHKIMGVSEKSWIPLKER